MKGQNCANLNFQSQALIPSTCSSMLLTMIHDQQNRPFLYVAGKEDGLKIYDISTLSSPNLILTIPISALNSLEVMSISQDSNFLYLATGNFFGLNPQHSGMSIVDITNPTTAFVTDNWEFPVNSGSGIVKVDGNFAYLGAMANGLFIFDISDKYDITRLSQFIPDIYFPDPNPDPAKYNARGMEVKNDIVYLCYDAGGLRIINVSDKNQPVETGRFSNPAMNGLARAYNNLVVDDSLIYITVDYCGLEVLNVADTANITLTGWWNPYNCPTNNWFTSPGHTNEIQFNKNCNQLFISSGKSDLHVIDISNPAQPDSCNYYGGISNNVGSWGIGLYQNQIYLSYICALVPFVSFTNAIEILTFDNCNVGIKKNTEVVFSISPNPVTDYLKIKCSEKNIFNENSKLIFTNVWGQQLSAKSITIENDFLIADVNDFKNGMYFLSVLQNNKFYSVKFAK